VQASFYNVVTVSGLGIHLFVTAPRPGDSEGTFSVFKSIAQGYNKRTCRPVCVKQESCEYQLSKSFGLIRPGNRAQVYRLRGGRSNY